MSVLSQGTQCSIRSENEAILTDILQIQFQLMCCHGFMMDGSDASALMRTGHNLGKIKES